MSLGDLDLDTEEINFDEVDGLSYHGARILSKLYNRGFGQVSAR